MLNAYTGGDCHYDGTGNTGCYLDTAGEAAGDTNGFKVEANHDQCRDKGSGTWMFECLSGCTGVGGHNGGVTIGANVKILSEGRYLRAYGTCGAPCNQKEIETATSWEMVTGTWQVLAGNGNSKATGALLDIDDIVHLKMVGSGWGKDEYIDTCGQGCLIPNHGALNAGLSSQSDRDRGRGVPDECINRNNKRVRNE